MDEALGLVVPQGGGGDPTYDGIAEGLAAYQRDAMAAYAEARLD